MSSNLGAVKQHLAQISSGKSTKPTDDEWYLYILMKDIGMSYNEILETPIPVLMTLMKCYSYHKKMEREAMKRKR